MKETILKVIIFAISFGFVEASVVVYLRHLLGASQPQIPSGETLFLVPGIAFLHPETAVEIIASTALLNVEMAREAATIIMLATVAFLSATRIMERLAYFFLAFGVWDIFYYIFLRLIIGWPKSLTDLDIFFLLPVPWIGPVFVPIVISSILIIGSLWYLVNEGKLTNDSVTKVKDPT